mgnify:CR=1 FL=1
MSIIAFSHDWLARVVFLAAPFITATARFLHEV